MAKIRQESRGGNHQTEFIACENNPGPDWASLSDELGVYGVIARATVVDRLCFVEEGDWSPEHRLVRADSVAEWVIEGVGPSAILDALASQDEVSVVEDIDPYRVRKLWLVNGAHLALGLWAGQRGLDSIDYAAKERGRREWIRGLHEAMSVPLLARHPAIPRVVGYGERHIGSWVRHRDATDRILKRLNRADLRPFLEDFKLKFGDCAREYVALGDSLATEMRQTFEILHWLLTDLEKYRDIRRRDQQISLDSPPTLSPELDAEAVEMYRTILTGIDQYADQRSSDLAAALEIHRERLRN